MAGGTILLAVDRRCLEYGIGQFAVAVRPEWRRGDFQWTLRIHTAEAVSGEAVGIFRAVGGEEGRDGRNLAGWKARVFTEMIIE